MKIVISFMILKLINLKNVFFYHGRLICWADSEFIVISKKIDSTVIART